MEGRSELPLRTDIPTIALDASHLRPGLLDGTLAYEHNHVHRLFAKEESSYDSPVRDAMVPALTENIYRREVGHVLDYTERLREGFGHCHGVNLPYHWKSGDVLTPEMLH